MSVLVENNNFVEIQSFKVKKQKCFVKGCKEIIDLVNKHECNKCKKIHCLYHRVYESHNCSVFLDQQKKEENILQKQRQKIILQNKLLKDLKKEFLG